MKATIDSDGYLKIEAGSIIEALDDASLRAFAKYAVFQEYLLRGVVDALATGQMWDGDDEPPWWFGGDTFNELRLKLVPLLPEITAQAVRHLEAETRSARRDRDEWREACWRLLREWPEGERPRHPITHEPRMTKEQAAAHLAAVERSVAIARAIAAPGAPELAAIRAWRLELEAPHAIGDAPPAPRELIALVDRLLAEVASC